MADHPYLQLKLDGGRYTGGEGVDVRTLGKLERLERALHALARHRFFQHNDTRTRAPPGFQDRFRLRLHRIESNCTMLKVARVDRPSEPLEEVSDDYDALDFHDLARESLLEILAASDDAVLARYPQEALHHVAELLGVIEPGEVVECQLIRGWGETSRKAVVNTQVARRIRDAAEAPRKLVTVPFYTCGRPYSLDRLANLVSIEFREHRRTARYPIKASGVATVAQILPEDRTELVRLAGVVRRDDYNHIYDFPQPLEATIVRGPNLTARLASFEDIEDGWLDGTDGRAVRYRVIGEARKTAWALVERVGMDRPFAYPTPEGGIQFEWELPQGQLELTVEQGAEGFRFGVFPLWLEDGDQEGLEDLDEVVAAVTELIGDDPADE